MIYPSKSIVSMILPMALIAAVLLTGCRAFQPEPVLVNRPPETFLVGAPFQGGGGYYHYHMFWYGSDEDGQVEKFVWALTDTSVQNEETADDEEDARFNPALDITHLEFAHWTTRTDSVFDFQINQGTLHSTNMTFHMVAVDDFGDFDRTPARLHFFSNTLGTPVIDFFRIDGADTVGLGSSQIDTVGFGRPYQLHWKGSTPNIVGYDASALALVDTIYPYDDGLYGYKWLLGGDLGGDCIPTFNDCWHPRLFNEATGDSFSYYGQINGLTFRNDGSSSGPFGKLLASRTVELRINSIDVAGVQVAHYLRNFTLVVNYAPKTILLKGERDWAHSEDPEIYPYYTLLNDPTGTHHPFGEGDRIPDRSYAVFKALAKDHPDDAVLDPGFKIGLTGQVKGVRDNYTGGPFSFSSGSSQIDYTPTWDAGLDGWYADTLGFLVGPRTEFTFSMQAVDEHGRRTQPPVSMNFEVGYPPCLQCIELLPDVTGVSNFTDSLECYDPRVPGHACFDEDTIDFTIARGDNGINPERTYLTEETGLAFLAISKNSTLSAAIVHEQPDTTRYYSIAMKSYSMTVLLHGQDDPREAWLDPINRVGAYRYQVDYDCDPGNSIIDGGGADDIQPPTWGYPYGTPDISINPQNGLWNLTVNFYIPTLLWQNGEEIFRNWVWLYFVPHDPDLADRLVDISIRQLSHGTVRAIALDQTHYDWHPTRPSQYHLFDDVRPPRPSLPPGMTWRDFDPPYDTFTSLRLDRGAMDSAIHDQDGQRIEMVREFSLTFEDSDHDLQCGGSR